MGGGDGWRKKAEGIRKRDNDVGREDDDEESTSGNVRVLRAGRPIRQVIVNLRRAIVSKWKVIGYV